MSWHADLTVGSFENDHLEVQQQTTGLVCLEMRNDLLCRLQIYVCINNLAPEITGYRLRA